VDQEVHATADREAGATGSRPIGTVQAIGNQLYTNWQTALISCGFSGQALFHRGRSERCFRCHGHSSGHDLEVITHDGQRHGHADAMAITRGHGEQKLPITPTLPAEDSLADERSDKGARIAYGQPLLPVSSLAGFLLAGFRLCAVQVELDALVVSLARIDLLEHRAIALHQLCRVHAGQKVQIIVGIVAVAKREYPALLPQPLE